MASKKIYKMNKREFQFLLWEQFKIDENICKLIPFQEFTKETINDLLSAAEDFAVNVLGPYYQEADKQGCSLDKDGNVHLPDFFPELWKEFVNAEWGKLGAPKQYGGVGAPYIVGQMINEIFLGANPSLTSFSGFCTPIIYLMEMYGNKLLKNMYSRNLSSTKWSGAFCMTEADAGSDVGNIKTKAKKLPDNTYLIEGNKTFISMGYHDITENIIYAVIARVEGAMPGTRGLSAFIVPRFRVDENGNMLAGSNKDNHVRCIGIERKMGLHACVTNQLSFGTDGQCIGHLLGDKENVGLYQIFSLMNQARITTGIFALGMASSAYLNAVSYSRERIQGVDIKQSFNPKAKSVAIINHGDVRRMLLEMKSKVEGCRALIMKLTYHHSIVTYLKYQEQNNLEFDKVELKYHESFVNLLTPVVKAYTSDQAWRICELAIQVYGGYGYTKDYPVEQYARDVKIMSIWEGTNFVQSADLLRFNLQLGRNKDLLGLLFNEINDFMQNNTGNSSFTKEFELLDKAGNSFKKTYELVGKFLSEQKINYIFTISTRFLEMLSEISISWLLLEQAVISEKALKQTDISEDDKNFYNGKVASAKFYVNNILPGVFYKAEVIASEDMTATDTLPEYFDKV